MTSTTIFPSISAGDPDAVAMVAAALIANDGSRLPDDATVDPIAGMIAATARHHLATSCAEAANRLAHALDKIESIKLGPAQDVVHDAFRGMLHADAVKATHCKAHHDRVMVERVARLARQAYEEAHPKAARFHAWRFTINLTLILLALGEVTVGAVMLSEVTDFFASDLAAFVFLATAVGCIFECGHVVGHLIGHSTTTRLSNFVRLVGIILATTVAIAVVVAIGMTRSNLPVSVPSLLLMCSDLPKHMSAFTLMGIEFAYFLFVASVTAARRRAGYNRDYLLLIVADRTATNAATQIRETIVNEAADGLAGYRKNILAVAETAAAAKIATAEKLAELETILRTQREARRDLVRSAASLFGQAVLLAHRDIATSGHPPLRGHDFEKQFEALIPADLPDPSTVSRLQRQALRIKVRAMRTERLASQALVKLDDIMNSVVTETYRQ